MVLNRSSLPNNLRRLNSSAPTLITPFQPLNHAGEQPIPDETSTTTTATTIDLADHKGLFSSFPTSKLIKSTATLHAAAIGPMVDFGTWAMNSRLMENPLFKKAVLGVTEKTFYSHFCAGKDLREAAETVRRLREVRLGAMLDYGLEHAGDDVSCDGNMEEIVRTIGWTKLQGDCRAGFVVVKITAISPPGLLKRVSDLLRWEYKDNSLHLPWKLKILPIFSHSSPLYHTSKRPQPLTLDEERDLQSAYDRLTKICNSASEANIPLLIDAEDTSIQPAIDYFAYSAAIKYNQENEDPLIFNTIQAYLKDAKERLVLAKEAADGMGVPIGFKLVRGAYMSSEKRLADSLGVESPIHDGIQETHACYNACTEFMLQEIACGSGSAILASHNIESGKLAARRAVDLGIEKNHTSLQFATLYGMAEALSFGLYNAGFRVSKYIPFGPVEQIMPYLLRRAEENRGLLSASSIDRQLMRKELVRRLTTLGT